MQITEVRIKLMERSEDRLRGFCSITFDNAFVVRDLKIIEGNNGPFVAMPSRKLTSHCNKCRSKNHLKAKFCNNGGAKQRAEDFTRDSDGRARLYADIAHPVNARCREMIQTRIIKEFNEEYQRSKQPGYVSQYHEDYDAGPDHSHNLPHDSTSDSKTGSKSDNESATEKPNDTSQQSQQGDGQRETSDREQQQRDTDQQQRDNKNIRADKQAETEGPHKAKDTESVKDKTNRDTEGGAFGEGILD